MATITKFKVHAATGDVHLSFSNGRRLVLSLNSPLNEQAEFLCLTAATKRDIVRSLKNLRGNALSAVSHYDARELISRLKRRSKPGGIENG